MSDKQKKAKNLNIDIWNVPFFCDVVMLLAV